LAELLDRRDLSEGFRWLAAAVVFCAMLPLLFSDLHLWTSLSRSMGDDKVILWVVVLAIVIVVGKALEGLARFQFGAYLDSTFFLASIGRGVSEAVQRKAGIGRLEILAAQAQRFLYWTFVPPLCVRAFVTLSIEMANDLTKDTGFDGTLRIDPLQRIVMFLAVSQPKIGDKWGGVEVECSRGLDRFLFFVTLGQTFLLVGIIGVCACMSSIHLGDTSTMLKQGGLAVVALLAAKVAKIASGQAFEELLVYVSALSRGFVPPVSLPSDELY